MAESGRESEKKLHSNSRTETVTKEKKSPKVVLKLQNSEASGRHVQWDQGTVDNEFMNKKKSKCCCIYTKPKAFDESDSDSSGDEDHQCTFRCRGHLPRDYKLPAEEPEEEMEEKEQQQSPKPEKKDSNGRKSPVGSPKKRDASNKKSTAGKS